MSLLVLLGLSATLDIIDHGILLDHFSWTRYEHSFSMAHFFL